MKFLKMTKFSISFFLPLLTFFVHSYAQQVNLQTGSPQINLPLYSISDANNRLSASVSLNYTAGNGIHVDDLGSSVGTGWEISGIGAVTREVIGVPDDQKQRQGFPEVYYAYTPQNENTELNNFANYVANYYPNGYLYSEYSPTDIITNAGSYSYTGPTSTGRFSTSTAATDGLVLPPQRYIADREMDIFTFDMNGRVGKFMIGKDHSIFFLNEKDKKLKIDPVFDETLINQNIRTTISGFTVTDEIGIQYVYKDMELNEVINYTQESSYDNASGSLTSSSQIVIVTTGTPNYGLANPCTPLSYRPYFTVLKGARTGQFICNKWVLTRVINPLTTKSLEYTYQTESVVAEGSHSVTHTNANGACSINITIPLISSSVKKVSSISNQYGDKIEFIYGQNRQDLPDDAILSKVNFYQNGTLVSDEAFAYGYFFQNTVTGFSTTFTAQQLPYTRLCLNQIQKEGLNGTLETPYTFQYYTSSGATTSSGSTIPGDIVPPRSTIFHDDFGYFNVNISTPLNTDNQLYAPANGNIYPFSIYSDYAGYSSGFTSIVAKNGLIKSMSMPTQGNITFNYEPNTVKSFIDGNSYQTFGVRVVSTLLNDVTTNTLTESDYTYTLSDGTSSSGWGRDGYDPPVYGNSKPVVQYYCPSGSSQNAGTILTSTALDIGKGLLSGQSLGAAVGSAGTSLFITILVNIIQTYFSNPPDHASYQSSFASNTPLNYNNLIPLSYSQVGIAVKNNGASLGKTVYYFTSYSDYPIEFSSSDPIYSIKQRYGYWKYGLLKKVETYGNSSSLPIKSVQNIYSLNSTNYNNSANYLSQHWAPNSLSLYCSVGAFTSNDATTGTSSITSEQYYPFSGKIDLISSVETNFDASGNNGVSRTTTYQYNADELPFITSQIDSKGQKFETVNTYPDDYTTGGTISTMQQVNNIASPVLTESYVYKSPTVKKLLSGSIINYGQVSNNDIKPVTTYEFRSPTANNTLVDNTSLQSFNPAQLIRDPVYYHPTTSLFYDNNGSLVQKTTEVGHAGYIYDQPFSDRLVAQVTNISPGQFTAYSSFEDNARGNWTYSGYSTINTSPNVPTGQYTYSLGQTNGNITIPSGLDPSTTYIVSYWSSGGSYNVTGSTNMTQGRTSNGWTYYQHTIFNVNSLTISGGGYLDELRLYPKGALMNTYTYSSPLFGVSSQCDANNKIVYYTYDDLGRKSTIRDQDQNIIKAFDYQYKNLVAKMGDNTVQHSYPITGKFNGGAYSDFGIKTDGGLWEVSVMNNALAGLPTSWQPSFGNDNVDLVGAPFIPITGDWNGDGITDIGMKTKDGRWYVAFADPVTHQFTGPALWLSNFGDENADPGGAPFVPITGDWDGDGKTDIGMKSNDGRWFIAYSDPLNHQFSGTAQWLSNFGNNNADPGGAPFIPITGDWDGDGKTDIGLKSSDGRWYAAFSDFTNHQFTGQGQWLSNFGNNNAVTGTTFLPITGDWNGDGKTDIGIKSSDGNWYVAYPDAVNHQFTGATQWLSNFGNNNTDPGGAPFVPITGDWDGDGKTDIGLKSNDGRWFIATTSQNGFVVRKECFK